MILFNSYPPDHPRTFTADLVLSEPMFTVEVMHNLNSVCKFRVSGAKLRT